MIRRFAASFCAATMLFVPVGLVHAQEKTPIDTTSPTAAGPSEAKKTAPTTGSLAYITPQKLTSKSGTPTVEVWASEGAWTVQHATALIDRVPAVDPTITKVAFVLVTGDLNGFNTQMREPLSSMTDPAAKELTRATDPGTLIIIYGTKPQLVSLYCGTKVCQLIASHGGTNEVIEAISSTAATTPTPNTSDLFITGLESASGVATRGTVEEELQSVTRNRTLIVTILLLIALIAGIIALVLVRRKNHTSLLKAFDSGDYKDTPRTRNDKQEATVTAPIGDPGEGTDKSPRPYRFARRPNQPVEPVAPDSEAVVQNAGPDVNDLIDRLPEGLADEKLREQWADLRARAATNPDDPDLVKRLHVAKRTLQGLVAFVDGDERVRRTVLTSLRKDQMALWEPHLEGDWQNAHLDEVNNHLDDLIADLHADDFLDRFLILVRDFRTYFPELSPETVKAPLGSTSFTPWFR